MSVKERSLTQVVEWCARCRDPGFFAVCSDMDPAWSLAFSNDGAFRKEMRPGIYHLAIWFRGAGEVDLRTISPRTWSATSQWPQFARQVAQVRDMSGKQGWCVGLIPDCLSTSLLALPEAARSCVVKPDVFAVHLNADASDRLSANAIVGADLENTEPNELHSEQRFLKV